MTKVKTYTLVPGGPPARSLLGASLRAQRVPWRRTRNYSLHRVIVVRSGVSPQGTTRTLSKPVGSASLGR
jgi:hypothetical protein